MLDFNYVFAYFFIYGFSETGFLNVDLAVP